MIKILSVVGARPNFMKIAPIVAAIRRRPEEISSVLVHTGQHYDEAMSASFFRDLKLPPHDIALGTRSGTHAEQTARIMLAFEGVLIAQQPDWVIVVGDVNSTLACALVAAKLGVPIAHVEAGLRSFDRQMPEEINRVLTDRLADLLLTPSADADENLLREGIDPARIVRVGNVMIDTLYRQLAHASRSLILETLGLSPREFAVVTMHRPSNVDNPAVLRRLMAALGKLALDLPVIFPAHPRTTSRLAQFGITVPENVRPIPPLGYLDFLGLWSRSRLVLTDSGGLQEETTALGVPCLTLRERTERPVTISEGTNRVVGTDPDRILEAASAALDVKGPVSKCIPALWDGHAGERIITALLERTPQYLALEKDQVATSATR